MSHAYCNQCRARVTVHDGHCLLDHPVDLTTLSSASGRRLKAGRKLRVPRSVAPTSSPPIAPPTTVVDLTQHPSRITTLATATGQARELEREREAPAALLDVLVEPRPVEVTSPPIESDPLDDPLLRDIAPTGDLIAELWGLDSGDGGSTSWRPADVDEDLIGTDRPRWRRRALIAVAALAAGWLAGGYLGVGPDPAARVAQNAASLSTAVAQLEPLAEDLADGAFESALDVGSTLGEVDRTARELFSSAAELDQESSDASQLRITSSDLATQALTVEGALADLAAYGSGVERITTPLTLPTTAADADLPELTARLAEWITTQSGEIDLLPRNQLTSEHRAAAEAFAAGLTEWQADYLDAVRSGTAADAERLVSELEQSLQDLRAGWETTATSSAQWVSDQLADLRNRAAAITPGP